MREVTAPAGLELRPQRKHLRGAGFAARFWAKCAKTAKYARAGCETFPIHVRDIALRGARACGPNLSHLPHKIRSDEPNADGEERRPARVEPEGTGRAAGERRVAGCFLPGCRRRRRLFSGSRSRGAHGFSSQCGDGPERGAAEPRRRWSARARSACCGASGRSSA